MAANSKIEWTDHTFNPWVGCEKVGPGCDNCYAESWAKRSGAPELWNGSRRRTKTWGNPIKWNEFGGARRQRVFCASLADVFDNEVDPAWRGDLWELVKSTPALDWIIVTKRIGNARKMLPADWGAGYPNVWLLATVVTQREFDRDVPKLLKIPAVVRGLSMEPLIERVDVDPRWIRWIIVGGESGPNRRYMDPDWAREIRDKCAGSKTAFFMKQMTGKAPIPADLQVREFPI